MNAIVALCSLIAHIMWLIFCIVTTRAAYHYYGSFSIAIVCTGLIVMQLFILWTLAFFFGGGSDNMGPAILAKSLVMFFLCYFLTFGDLSCANSLNEGCSLGTLVKNDQFLMYWLELPDDATPYQAAKDAEIALALPSPNGEYDSQRWREANEWMKVHKSFPKWILEDRDRWLEEDKRRREREAANNPIEYYGKPSYLRLERQKKQPWLSPPPSLK